MIWGESWSQNSEWQRPKHDKNLQALSSQICLVTASFELPGTRFHVLKLIGKIVEST